MIEAVVIGRIGVDFTPASPRTTLAAASSFSRAVGGFAGNIGIGLARLGIPTAVVSKVGSDGHGDHVRSALAAEGIDVSALGIAEDSRTQVAFFEAWPPDRFPVTFYRPTPAPDTRLDDADLAAAVIGTGRAVVVSGALLAEEPARSATLSAMERRAGGGRRHGDARGPDRSWTILDLDWRPTLWSHPREYPRLIREAIGHSDVVIGGDEELAAAEVPADVVAAGLGPDGVVVLKHGPAGASLLEHGERHDISGIAVDVTCGLGAGDALTAAFTAGLLHGLPPVAALERGNAAGAIVATRLMCSSAMPAPAEIDALLATTAGSTRMTRVVA